MIAPIVRCLETIRVWTWRRIAIVYTIALFTGTHWPKFTIPVKSVIPIDKVLHVIAFAGLAGFWMLARFLPRRETELQSRAFTRERIIWVVGVSLVWAVFDELAQAYPGSGRFPTLLDWSCNAAGILLAGAVAMFVFAPISARLTLTADAQIDAIRSDTPSSSP